MKFNSKNNEYAEVSLSDFYIKLYNNSRGSILSEKSGLRCRERGNKTNGLLTKRVASLPDLSPKDNAKRISMQG